MIFDSMVNNFISSVLEIIGSSSENPKAGDNTEYTRSQGAK